MTHSLVPVRNGHGRRCPAPLQGWEWIFGEGIAQGVWEALVVRSERGNQDIPFGGESA